MSILSNEEAKFRINRAIENTESSNYLYKVAIYIRLSKEDKKKKRESESESVQNQRKLLHTYIKEHNLVLTEEYVDDGYSGTTFDRPSFNRLIKDIEDGKINMVITKDLSRLGRDYIQSGYYLEQYFPMKKVRYISVLDNIDTAMDTTNNDIAPFKSLFNDMQSKDNSKKIRSILRDGKKRGLFLGSDAAFGYMRDPNDKHKLIIDPNTAPIVRKIFDLALSGKSNGEISLILNQEKIITPVLYKKRRLSKRNRNPELWTCSSVYQILKNEMYTGNMVQGVQAKLNYKTKKRIVLDKDQWIIVPNTHEAIVSKEEFDIVNKSSKRRKTHNQRDKLTLEGLVFCKECGCTLGLKKDARNKNNIHYTMNCNRYLRNPRLHLCEPHFLLYSDLEEGVLSLVKKQCEQINKENIIEEINSLEKNDYHEKEKLERNELERRKVELTRKLKSIYDDKFNGIISTDTYILLSQDIEKNLKQLSERVQHLDDILQTQKKVSINATELANRFLNEKPSRDLIFSIIDKITVSKDKEINIYYNFSNK